MFDFLLDAGNYDTRKLGRDDFDWGFVSTCRVSDGAKPYETAVKHSGYVRKDGAADQMCIIENYDTAAQAKAGHTKWVRMMTAEKLPKKLTDCANSEVSQVLDSIDDSRNTMVWTLRKTRP